MKILITGGAGFIGSALARVLSAEGDEVTIADNLNTYYSIKLKEARLRALGLEAAAESVSNKYSSLRFLRADITSAPEVERLFSAGPYDAVCNLAAQAGVRYSIDHPRTYIETNILGFFNIIDACRRHATERLVYASSSSVYGGNEHTPFSERDRVDDPRSLYAATKRSDELIAHVYSRLYGTGVTGLRYFTVYGPWGRPDMSPVIFADAITAGKPLKLFNGGDMIRDFTYISDIVSGTVLALRAVKPGEEKVYNIGCSHPVKLMDFISALESALGKKAAFELLPMQKGDVHVTSADTSLISSELGYRPTVGIAEGTCLFAAWYRDHKALLH